jgi:transglutaminase-like putative cysteine protease
MTLSQEKPNFLVYVAWLGVFALAINTVYLVLPNEHMKWYLLGILVVAVMTGFIASNRYYASLGLILDIAGLATFLYYAYRIFLDRGSFGTYLGEMLAVMLVLRCFKLFRQQDFVFPLIISLTLIVFSAIPSFSADFVYSLLGFLLLMGVAMFLGSVDEFARLPGRKTRHSQLRYTYDFLDDYTPIPVSQKTPRQVLKFLRPALMSTVPVVFFAWMISSGLYFTVDHSLTPGTENDILTAFGSNNFTSDEGQESALLTGVVPNGQAQHYTGFDTEFNIAQGRLLENSTSTEVVMEVESNLPSYWRGKCFDTYTGRGWEQGDGIPVALMTLRDPSGRNKLYHGEVSSQPNLRGTGIDLDPQIYRNEIRQTYYLMTDLPRIVFAAYQPTEISLPVPGVRIDDTFTLVPPESSDSMVAGQTYQVVSSKMDFSNGAYLDAYDYDALKFAQEEPDFVSRYTQLPERGSLDDPQAGFDFTRIRAKAFEITAGADTVYQRVDALMRFLESNYNYSLNPPAAVPDTSDAVDYFLFDWDQKRGHCEYFSSALAVLCRSIGIPSRVATGYSTGTYSLLKNRYIVQARNAHAWVEIFWPEIGWVEFDPTPQGWAQGIGERAAGGWLVFHNMVENLYVYDPIGEFRTKIFPAILRGANLTRTFILQRELDFFDSVQPLLTRFQENRDEPLWILVMAFAILLLSYVTRRMFNSEYDKNLALFIGRKSILRIRRILLNKGFKPELLSTEMDCALQAGKISPEWGDSVRMVVDEYQYAVYSGRRVGQSNVSTLKKAARLASRVPAM